MDERLLEKAMNDYGDMVLRIAYSVTGNKPDAEDVFSDVFFQLYKAKQSFNGESHLKAWLIRCAINRAKNVKTQAYHRRRAELDENLPYVDTYRDLDLINALKGLKKDERAILYLHYYEGYTFDEIAQTLKLNASSVRSKASRARQTLKILLDD